VADVGELSNGHFAGLRFLWQHRSTPRGEWKLIYSAIVPVTLSPEVRPAPFTPLVSPRNVKLIM
jgi:hypothetical protein